MEAAPAPAPTIVTAAVTAAAHVGSLDSSPRSRHAECFDTDPPLATPRKLRLMCSYGGHIVPRPHDKTLCYVGGDTRIVVIDRNTSLSDLQNRLSKTLQNQSFSLKYQLPNEDLDSLISVTSDEDLENMVEEYDRLNNAGGSVRPGRLRVFLFPKSTSSIEQLLAETGSAKSEEWFFNALNGKASTVSGGVSDRGLSESSSINNLLGLDEDPLGKSGIGGKVGENQAGIGSGNSAVNHDAHSIPDSPMLHTTSSFDSTSSSPYLANLPPIKVHVQEKPKVLGIEDQFQQMNAGGGGNSNVPPPQKPEEMGFFVTPAPVAPSFPVVPLVIGGEFATNTVNSDDDRSDHGGYLKAQQLELQRQAQLPQQPVAQTSQKPDGVTDLPSPGSVSSEGSSRNPLSRQVQVVYQEPMAQIPSGNSRVTPDLDDDKTGEPNSIKFQVQPQVQEHGYIVSGQSHPFYHQQQQLFHAGNQYIPAGAVPMASYFPVYASQQQHHPHQPLLDQPYPFYFMPARPTQAYNLQAQQQTYSELAQSASSTRSQTPPPSGVSHHVAYAPTVGGPSSKPELSTGMYRAAGPQLVQIPSGQHQTQYVGFSHIPHPSQSINPSSINSPAFTYNFADPGHPQLCYTQPLPPHLAAHYQTLATSPAAVMSNASPQPPAENLNNQVKPPQP